MTTPRIWERFCKKAGIIEIIPRIAVASYMEVACLSPRPNMLEHYIASSSDLRMDNLYAKPAKARPKPTSSKAS